jgi:phosphoglycolate phosphatase-like HAD superfamily hydrolase
VSTHTTAVILDVDGTLVDTSSRQVRYALSELPFTSTPVRRGE